MDDVPVTESKEVIKLKEKCIRNISETVANIATTLNGLNAHFEHVCTKTDVIDDERMRSYIKDIGADIMKIQENNIAMSWISGLFQEAKKETL